ncbi:lipopolysaccharide biosynthesis protein, partial [Vibrio antiquarius]|uniref:lipopolysaccharide biosynthesis protein n=1 Tax=Vibrio antiquarius (strain Ex25) TaxID=150340 RepID=UPI00265AC166
LEYISKTLFLVVIINSFSVVTRAKLTINVDFKSQAQSNTVATISGSVAAIVLANMGFGYWSIVGLALVKAFVSTIFLSYFCDWKPKLFFCYYSFKRLFKFGSNLMIAGLLSTLANNLHAILIGRYFNATYVGYYSQGVNLTNTLSGIISSVFYGVSYPILTSINEDREKLVQAYEKVVKMTMLVSMPCMLGFAAVADTFTELFLGEQWLPVIPILVILSIARMLTPISLVNMNILNAIGRSDLFLKVDLIKIPIFVFAILIAVPYGIHGIAIANLLTTILSFFINAYFPGKIFNFGAREQIKVSMRIIISSTIMYFVVSFVSIQDLWIELVFKVFTGAFLYIFGLFILRENSIKILYRQISLGLKN